MDPITEHHYRNIANGKSKRLDNGELATVRTIIVEIDGVETLIPTIWDGELVDDETAKRFSKNSGVDWPTRSGPDAVSELEAFDTEIHKKFTDTTSAEEAQELLDFTFRNEDVEITVPEDSALMDPIYLGMAEGTTMEDGPGTGLRLTGETFPDGAPMWEVIPKEDTGPSPLAVATSERPKERPSPEYFAEQERLLAESQQQEFEDHKAHMQYEEYVRVFGEDDSSTQLAENEYALGGFATANKGITTTEGLDMAKQKFQLDRKKADKDGDGKLSKYEEASGEAIQKAMDDDEIIEMSHGGMACGDGMMSDSYSGNDIPLGSSAENVADDIEAMISEGEYVLPANVVKWHGLKSIMDMQAEAEMGLMGMYDMGLIQYASEEGAEEPEEVVEADEDDAPEEDIEIEIAAVKVDDKLDDDDEIEEIYPDTSYPSGAMKKPRFSFMS